ncbi:MAG: tRNA uridine-5-carboxymethylaminomethyl(34) synthesis enzyme MnmG [Victivallaceae bacterium]|nr:tRNA uridine-5-carboxymethylaminomethyl(34) synthesis enzyme MnmG [Victivallaceae bacterium]
MNHYDVIVVGAGHAGCEAAFTAARVGAKTLLLTINMDHIAQMSCNPAIGGIAKGQVVREIDALGGAQGIITDAAAIQFRMLNQSKGPAVWSPRAQCDKVCFQRAMKFFLEQQPNLTIKQAMVTDYIIEDEKVAGVETDFKDQFYAASIVITTGTFLNGKLHYGMNSFAGGRAGDPASVKLATAFRTQLGLKVGRLKTGTPPRIQAKTIDFSQMRRQNAEVTETMFSYYSDTTPLPRAGKRDMPCFMANSSKATAQLVKDNLHKAPLYQGKIEGIGTRYCPSFEDKIVRFPHHETHMLYLEPEGEFTDEYYINGISTSLPPDIQVQMIHSVPGLENAEISRYAYAIEYDFIFPNQLDRSLRVKKWPNLFLAGQINGTSGYEEAAGQGLVAGLNAARCAAGKIPVELARDSSYIGVMIDDLVTKEIKEPYRLFTSRAEYRLRLRQDNADLRLGEFAIANNLLPANKLQQLNSFCEHYTRTQTLADKVKHQGKTLSDNLKQLRGIYQPDITPLPFPVELLELESVSAHEANRVIEQLAVNAHYEGYLKREERSIGRLQTLENWKIAAEFDYDAITGMRNESRMKLKQVKPTTLAQAGRIDGVTPAEIALLQVHLKRAKK